MSEAILSQGIEFRRGDGGGTEAFTKVAEVIDFQGPGGESADIDVTSLDSVAKEFRNGLQDEGNFSFNCILDTSDTEQEGLRTDRAAGTLRNFELMFPDGINTVLSFAATVKGFSVAAGVDDVVRASVTLRISGAVTWGTEAT